MTKQFTPKFQNAAAIEKAIASIHNRGKKLDQDIQDCGLSILSHIDKCGDVTVFWKLYEAMPRGSRRNALVDWACSFGKLAVNLDDATKKDKPFVYSKDKATNIEGAVEKPWFEFKPEKALDEEFDFASKLASLLRQAAEAEKRGTTIKGADVLAKLRAVSEPVAKAEEA